jgi:opacity protein-like surface antigen
MAVIKNRQLSLDTQVEKRESPWHAIGGIVCRLPSERSRGEGRMGFCIDLASAWANGERRARTCFRSTLTLGLSGGLLVGMVSLAASTATAADWRVYTSAGLGYSAAEGSADGRIIDNGGGQFPLGGSDTDVSPLLGGAVGLAVPMDQIAPIELPFGWRLPEWDVRAEIEAVGLRSYQFKTDPIQPGSQTAGPILTDLDTWSVMGNFWLDVPLRGLYKPISWTSARLFGRWRLRTLKKALDRTTLDMGVGVGVAHLDTTTTESGTRGTGDDYNFAWQAGVGLGYQLTDRVNLSLGYRYIDPGTAKYQLSGNGVDPNENSFFELDTDIHEARAAIRVDVWDFASPWR